MKLGILVNTDRHLKDIVGITGAALSKGHEVSIFVMGQGIRLLEDSGFSALSSKPGVTMSFCDLNASRLGIAKGSVPEEIVSGSQLDNARMVHEADRVVRL